MYRLSALAAAAAASLSLTGTAASAAPATYELDPEHTTIAFLVDHVGYAKILGRFREVSGSFVYDDETQELSEVSVTVPADSVFSDNDRRDDHVRSADFLNAGEYPEITFTADSGTVTGEGEGTVTGDLTILGQTRPVTLDVTLNKNAVYPFGHQKPTLGVSIRGSVMRSEYGMTYGIDGGLVGDEVELLIELEAIEAD